ncbi:hypothetical protein C7974DRAFT_564 [Boeremia exigua]|uniref:uncharacterized protein n=1 Tax=Boeremia exigua TaxID=749465 RepID=UPI001E8D34A7|nr:uncharacterized protein C7974DRAFT_564 [Boeremia exigua]KAH6643547.1 hypothetical protein C7974DRAFT_564 [Boeremia exigua]
MSRSTQWSSQLPRQVPHQRSIDYDAYPTMPRAPLPQLTHLPTLDRFKQSRREPRPKNCYSHGKREAQQQRPDPGSDLDFNADRRRVDSPHTNHTRDDAGDSHPVVAWSYVPSGTPYLSLGKRVEGEREVGVQEDLYDEEGFLIEEESLTSTGSAELLRDRQASGHPPVPYGQQTHSTLTRPERAPTANLAWWQKKPRPRTAPRKTTARRNVSQFSFDQDDAEEAVMCTRAVVDAEKKRRQRQVWLGLATCDLALDKRVFGSVQPPELDYVSGVDTSGVHPERSYLPPDHPDGLRRRLRNQEVALHGVPSHWERLVQRQAMVPQDSWEHVQFEAESSHPLAVMFGTADERAEWLGDPTSAMGGTQGSVPVGYCDQCSSLHVGRLTNAQDSVIEGFEQVNATELDGEAEKPKASVNETATDDEGRYDESRASWCWPFRCMRDELADSEKVKPCGSKLTTQRKKPCKLPRGMR